MHDACPGVGQTKVNILVERMNQQHATKQHTITPCLLGDFMGCACMIITVK